MRAQLRLYDVKPGEMAAFLNAFESYVVPVRRQFGFRVLATWRAEDDMSFGWLVAYEGEGAFEEANDRYYESPERAGIPDDPAQYLSAVSTRMVEAAL